MFVGKTLIDFTINSLLTFLGFWVCSWHLGWFIWW